MSKIVECVPNFSEGRSKEIVDAIGAAIKATKGCSLLSVEPGASTNRTVYTFVGTPEDVVEGALNAAKVAFKLINMAKHKGEHPRIGAMDVCPFVPVSEVTMEDCIACANNFAERLAKELGLPSYLYGFAAKHPNRKTIPPIRAGEYEGLPLKLKTQGWEPDYGSKEFNPRWGITLVGARNFLIAYNVNLLSTKEQAHRIALDVREQGRGPTQPGKLKCVQAIGWYLKESNLAQVSINLTDLETTGLHEVFEEVSNGAKELKIPVVGSQIVGVVPLKVLLAAADFYINKENLFILEEDQKIFLAIERLGLNSLGEFKPKEKIIEYMTVKEDDDALMSLSLKFFVKNVADRVAVPGGGSVSALSASLGSALSMMAGYLTYGNKKFAHLDESIRKLLSPIYSAMNYFIGVVDADSQAYDNYISSLRLPKDTDEEIEKRNKEIEASLRLAINVPMSMMKKVNELWPIIRELSSIANIVCLSDLQVGVRSLEMAVWGGHYNVLANIKQMKDKEEATKVMTMSMNQVKIASDNAIVILKVLDERYQQE